MTKAWSEGPSHKDACVACGGETKRIKIAPFDSTRDVWFYTCCNCEFTVGFLKTRPHVTTAILEGEEPMSLTGEAQRRADADDAAYERNLGCPGHCVCDPVY